MNHSTVSDVKRVGAWGRNTDWEVAQGVYWAAGNALYLELGEHTDAYT